MGFANKNKWIMGSLCHDLECQKIKVSAHLLEHFSTHFSYFTSALGLTSSSKICYNDKCFPEEQNI